MPDTTYIDAEAQRLKGQIDAAEQLVATTTDPDEKLAAQTRLDKLNDDYRLILVAGANAARTTTATANPTTTINGQVWGPDPANPNGPWVVRGGPGATPANLDEEQLKAVENQMAGAKRDEIERNRAAGKGGLTDDQVRTLDRLSQDSNTSAATLQLARDKWEKNNAAELAQIQAGTKKTTAETGLIGAQTDLTSAQMAALKIKTEADADEAYARGDLTRAQADQIKQKLKQPTIQDLGTGATYGVMTPGGTIEERYRQGYVPKTQAEIAARAGQIQTLMRQKAAELKGKIGANYSAEDANRDFNAWADQNVDPQQTALAAASEEANFARANLENEQRRLAMTGALAAGTQAREAFTAAAPYRVGENYGQGFEKMLNASLKGSGHGNIDMTGSATWKGPDMMSQSPQQATMEALKYLSPTAAAATGAPQPNYQGVDLNQAFSRAPFQFGGGPPAAPGAPAPAAGVGPTPDQLAAQQAYNRRMASFQTEAATNQQPNAFQGINPGGMAALIAQQQAAAAAPPPAPAAPVAAAAQVPARFMPSAAPPPAAPPPAWGTQASESMNVGGWNTPQPWGPAASGAMNVGGWNSPMPPPFGYGPPNLPSNTTYIPPPELAPPGIQGLNLPGMNVQGMNLGGQFSGVPWADLLNRYRFGGGGGNGNAGFTP